MYSFFSLKNSAACMNKEYRYADQLNYLPHIKISLLLLQLMIYDSSGVHSCQVFIYLIWLECDKICRLMSCQNKNSAVTYCATSVSYINAYRFVEYRSSLMKVIKLIKDRRWGILRDVASTNWVVPIFIYL